MKPCPSVRQFAFALVIGALLIGTAGCAAGARTTEMVATSAVPPTAPGEAGYRQFRVDAVQGGSETNAMWMSNVSNVDFKAALEASLRAANYLADEAEKARYAVTANMVDLKRPLAGFDMSVTTRVRYSATDTADQSVVFDDTVAATGTGKMGDAFIGVERLRIANEKAVQANIEAFLQRLREGLRSKPGA